MQLINRSAQQAAGSRLKLQQAKPMPRTTSSASVFSELAPFGLATSSWEGDFVNSSTQLTHHHPKPTLEREHLCPD